MTTDTTTDRISRRVDVSPGRATAVAGELVKHGIDDRQLRLVACGDHDRVKALAYDDLRTGRLVAPFEIEATADRAFHLVCPSGHETRPKISAFRAWIRDEVDRLGDAI